MLLFPTLELTYKQCNLLPRISVTHFSHNVICIRYMKSIWNPSLQLYMLRILKVIGHILEALNKISTAFTSLNIITLLYRTGKSMVTYVTPVWLMSIWWHSYATQTWEYNCISQYTCIIFQFMNIKVIIFMNILRHYYLNMWL
jgi:hypothetical protein